MRSEHIIGTIGIVLVVGIIIAVIMLRSAPQIRPATPTPPAAPVTPAKPLLSKTDEVIGTGAEAVSGKKVTVNYTGTLQNGTKFDSSYDHNQPFSFTLGRGEVIQGWDDGVVGMKVGGKRKLVIPPELAYGDRGQGSIPPNSTLTFEIELISVD